MKRGRRVARGGGRVTLSWVDPHPRGLNPGTSEDIKQHPIATILTMMMNILIVIKK